MAATYIKADRHAVRSKDIASSTILTIENMRLLALSWVWMSLVRCHPWNGHTHCDAGQQNCCTGFVGHNGHLQYEPHVGIDLVAYVTKSGSSESTTVESISFNEVHTHIHAVDAQKYSLKDAYIGPDKALHYTISGREMYVIVCALDSTKAFELYLYAN